MKRKNNKGFAILLPIIGVLVLGVVGLVVAKNLIRKDSGVPIPAQTEQQQQVNLTGQLQNASCGFSFNYPDGWEETLNSDEGGCRIGLKSSNLDAPFALLISQVQDGQSLEEYQQSLDDPQRISGTNFSRENITILGNANSVRLDEADDKGVVSTYFSNNSKIFEVVGLYSTANPSTRTELIQILSSIQSI